MFKHKSESKSVDELFDAILTLKTREECYLFFEDAATITEIKTLAQRLEVAKRLANNETYANIAKETGVSATTICRVKSYLLYGAEGYQLVMDRLAQQKKDKEEK